MFALTGCLKNAKEIEGSGISITLNSTFVEKEVLQVPFYLESTQHIFMGNRERKTDLSSAGVSTLEQYIEAVLSVGGKTATVEEYDEEDMHYLFAYYTSIVNEQDFGYMLVVMEGENHFYTLTFGCFENKLEGNKAQYTKWIKTATVE